MRRQQKKPGGLLPAFLCAALLMLALALLCTVLYRLFRGGQAESPAEPVLPPAEEQTEGSRWGPMIEGLAKNEYDEQAFRVQTNMITYASDGFEALQGIDVSAHNGEIDWTAVAQSGVDFAILQVGYRGYESGRLAADARFYANADGATANGIAIGAYFFSQCLSVAEAEEEARYVVELLSGMQLDWPVFFDWEPVEGDARTSSMDTQLLTDCALAFCRIITEAGFRAGIYFNQEYGYLHYNLLALEGYDFWLAEYADVPTFYYNFSHWQYSCTSSVDGIATAVDRNLSFIDYRSASQ